MDVDEATDSIGEEETISVEGEREIRQVFHMFYSFHKYLMQNPVSFHCALLE